MALPRRIPLFALFAALGACHSFGPPRPATLAAIAPLPLARVPFERFELELASPVLTGTFDGVFARTPDGFALQLFPDVGGKVFDLEFGTGGIRAWTPAGEYAAAPPFAAATPHLALVLAMVFAELGAPVTGERLLGERDGGAGVVQVLLAPALGGGRVEATLGTDGAITSYAFALGHLAFVLSADGRIGGTRITGRLQPVPF